MHIIRLHDARTLILMGHLKCLILLKYFFMEQQPLVAKASSGSRKHDHTQTHHIRQDNSGRVISHTRRPLSDNTQHSQETDVHASGGIRSRNPSKPRLIPRSALKDLYCVLRDSQCDK
jgi:hypothetical protein